MQLRVSVLMLSSQHGSLGNQCISVTQTSAGPQRVQSDWNVIYGRTKTTWLVSTVMHVMWSCDSGGCIICVISLWLWCGLASVSWLAWCDVCSGPSHVTWRSACHHAMIATVCTNHNQGPWPARNALCQWPVSRHAPRIYKLQSRP